MKQRESEMGVAESVQLARGTYRMVQELASSTPQKLSSLVPNLTTDSASATPPPASLHILQSSLDSCARGDKFEPPRG